MNRSELRFGADVCRSVLVVVLVLALGKPVTAATQLATEVGPAATDAVTLPVPLNDIVAVSAGYYHTCAVTTGGGWCGRCWSCYRECRCCCTTATAWC